MLLQEKVYSSIIMRKPLLPGDLNVYLRYMGAPLCFSAISVCLNGQQSPFRKASSLKERICSHKSKFLPFRVDIL